MAEVIRGSICRTEKGPYTVQLGEAVNAFCPLPAVLAQIVSEYAVPTDADMEVTGLPGSLTRSRQEVSVWSAAQKTDLQERRKKREGEDVVRQPSTRKIRRQEAGGKYFPLDLVENSDGEEDR
jgi:hypothetical protein